jgi:hypothetical protein
MKIERICNWEANGSPAMAEIRIMRTACPLCHREVSFAMMDDDFLKEDNEFLQTQNDKLKEEIRRLNKVINKLVT